MYVKGGRPGVFCFTSSRITALFLLITVDYSRRPDGGKGHGPHSCRMMTSVVRARRSTHHHTLPPNTIPPLPSLLPRGVGFNRAYKTAHRAEIEYVGGLGGFLESLYMYLNNFLTNYIRVTNKPYKSPRNPKTSVRGDSTEGGLRGGLAPYHDTPVRLAVACRGALQPKAVFIEPLADPCTEGLAQRACETARAILVLLSKVFREMVWD